MSRSAPPRAPIPWRCGWLGRVELLEGYLALLLPGQMQLRVARLAVMHLGEERIVAEIDDGIVGGLPVVKVRDDRGDADTTLMPGTLAMTTKELMARIGHASPRAALIYQHATKERDRVIADYLDEQVAAAAASAPRAPVVPIRPTAST